jgi:hypothetical protein
MVVIGVLTYVAVVENVQTTCTERNEYLLEQQLRRNT